MSTFEEQIRIAINASLESSDQKALELLKAIEASLIEDEEFLIEKAKKASLIEAEIIKEEEDKLLREAIEASITTEGSYVIIDFPK
jgi:hypothetical protein